MSCAACDMKTASPHACFDLPRSEVIARLQKLETQVAGVAARPWGTLEGFGRDGNEAAATA